jgi:hypothetical protein
MFLAGTLILIYSPQPVKAQVTYLDDGFETGNFSQWSGTKVTSGETLSVSGYRSLIGAYGGKATSNGGGGVEYAYCQKTLSSSELYARGYFYVSQSGIRDDNDRIFFIIFRAGTTGVAFAGWRRTGGVVKWCLTIKDGTGWMDTYGSYLPSVNNWYSVELHWKNDMFNGVAEMWVNGALVCSTSGRNTAAYGSVTSAQFGLPQIVNCASNTLYFDCVKISSEPIGILPWWYDTLGLYGAYTLFENGFESGSFSGWSGTATSSGGARSVVNTLACDGIYSARFTSGTATSQSGKAYCYKYIYLAPSYIGHFEIDACFRIATCNIPGSTGRIELFNLYAKGTVGASIGVAKIGGVLKWFISVRNGANMAYIYSQNTVIMNRWCKQALSVLYVDGGPDFTLQISYVGGGPSEGIAYSPAPYDWSGAFGNFDRVSFGLPKTVNCRAVTAYCDSFKMIIGGSNY